MSCSSSHPHICALCKQPTALTPGGLCDSCQKAIIAQHD